MWNGDGRSNHSASTNADSTISATDFSSDRDAAPNVTCYQLHPVIHASLYYTFVYSESGTIMNQKRFSALSQKIVGELAYVRPNDPYEYLKAYLVDPEGPVTSHFHKLAKDQDASVRYYRETVFIDFDIFMALSQGDKKRPSIEAYFRANDIQPFIQAIAEKLIADEYMVISHHIPSIYALLTMVLFSG